MPAEPWLTGLCACATHTDAAAVVAVLRARGLKSRSVPGGGARAAWTCAAGARGTVAVVVSGTGIAAARSAAAFWVPRTTRIVVTGAALDTGRGAPGTVVADGDEHLLEAAVAAEAVARPAGIATVETLPASQPARQSLAAAGVSAVDTEAEAWRQAGRATGAHTLVCFATFDPDSTNPPGRISVQLPPGSTGRSRSWRAWHLLRHPGDRAALTRLEEAHRAAATAAARVAITVLLGAA